MKTKTLTAAIAIMILLPFGILSSNAKESSPIEEHKTTGPTLKKVSISNPKPKKDEPIIVTPKNSHIKIKLKENTGSTGYQWFLNYNHNLLELYK